MQAADALWIRTPKQIENESPSRKDGIPLRVENSQRRLALAFCEDVGRELKMEPLTIGTATTYWQRFFLYQSLAKNDSLLIASACLLLAGKVREDFRSLESITKATYYLRQKKCPVAGERIKRDKRLQARESQLICKAEEVLCVTLDFNFVTSQPENHLWKLLKGLVGPIGKEEKKKTNFCQIAVNLCNDSRKTTLCLQGYGGVDVALACINLSSNLNKYELPSPSAAPGQPWWSRWNITKEKLAEIERKIMAMYTTRGPGSSSQTPNSVSHARVSTVPPHLSSLPSSSAGPSRLKTPASVDTASGLESALPRPADVAAKAPSRDVAGEARQDEQRKSSDPMADKQRSVVSKEASRKEHRGEAVDTIHRSSPSQSRPLATEEPLAGSAVGPSPGIQTAASRSGPPPTPDAEPAGSSKKRKQRSSSDTAALDGNLRAAAFSTNQSKFKEREEALEKPHVSGTGQESMAVGEDDRVKEVVVEEKDGRIGNEGKSFGEPDAALLCPKPPPVEELVDLSVKALDDQRAEGGSPALSGKSKQQLSCRPDNGGKGGDSYGCASEGEVKVASDKMKSSQDAPLDGEHGAEGRPVSSAGTERKASALKVEQLEPKTASGNPICVPPGELEGDSPHVVADSSASALLTGKRDETSLKKKRRHPSSKDSRSGDKSDVPSVAVASVAPGDQRPDVLKDKQGTALESSLPASAPAAAAGMGPGSSSDTDRHRGDGKHQLETLIENGGLHKTESLAEGEKPFGQPVGGKGGKRRRCGEAKEPLPLAAGAIHGNGISRDTSTATGDEVFHSLNKDSTLEGSSGRARMDPIAEDGQWEKPLSPSAASHSNDVDMADDAVAGTDEAFPSSPAMFAAVPPERSRWVPPRNKDEDGDESPEHEAIFARQSPGGGALGGLNVREPVSPGSSAGSGAVWRSPLWWRSQKDGTEGGMDDLARQGQAPVAMV